MPENSAVPFPATRYTRRIAPSFLSISQILIGLGSRLLPSLQMAEKMSYNPAKIVGLDKGDIAPGKTADIVIFDPNETYKIDKNKFASKGRNTPFDGRTVTGKVKMTIVGGHIEYEE